MDSSCQSCPHNLSIPPDIESLFDAVASVWSKAETIPPDASLPTLPQVNVDSTAPCSSQTPKSLPTETLPEEGKNSGDVCKSDPLNMDFAQTCIHIIKNIFDQGNIPGLLDKGVKRKRKPNYAFEDLCSWEPSKKSKNTVNYNDLINELSKVVRIHPDKDVKVITSSHKSSSGGVELCLKIKVPSEEEEEEGEVVVVAEGEVKKEE